MDIYHSTPDMESRLSKVFNEITKMLQVHPDILDNKLQETTYGPGGYSQCNQVVT